MAILDYLCDELARYEMDDGWQRGRISRLLGLGYTPDEIVKGINPQFVWDDTHGRLDTNEK